MMSGRLGLLRGWVASHKIWTVFVGLMAAATLTVGVVIPIQEGAQFDGSTRPGGHEWWDQDVSQFCTNCHVAPGTEIAAGPHVSAGLSSCTFCHSAGGGAHAAEVGYCTDCHVNVGTDLGNDAHDGVLTAAGETPTEAALACKSCHTHIEVNITSSPQPPIELIMGG